MGSSQFLQILKQKITFTLDSHHYYLLFSRTADVFSRPNQSSSIMDNCRTSKYGFFEECFADTFRCITVAQWTNDGKKNTMLHNKLISAICISLLSSSCKMLIQHSIILPTATWQPLLFSIVWNQCGWKSHLHLELYACKVRLRKIQIFLLQKAEKTILERFFFLF